MPAKKKTSGDDVAGTTNPISSTQTNDQSIDTGLNFSLNIGEKTIAQTDSSDKFGGQISDFSDMMMDQEIDIPSTDEININLDEETLPEQETTEQPNLDITETNENTEPTAQENEISTMNFDLSDVTEETATPEETTQPVAETIDTSDIFNITEETQTTEQETNITNDTASSAPIFSMPSETVTPEQTVPAETVVQQPTVFTPIIETPKTAEVPAQPTDMTFDLGSISEKPQTSSPALIPIEELEKKVEATESNVVKEELSNINTNNITSRPRHATAAPVSKGFFFMVAFIVLAAGGYFVYDFMYSSQGAQTDILGSTNTPDNSISTGDESASDTSEENTTMDSEDSTGDDETMTGDTISENSTGDALVDDSSDESMSGDISTGSTSDKDISTTSSDEEDSITTDTDSDSSNTKSPVKESTNDDENQIKIDENSNSDTESITTSDDSDNSSDSESTTKTVSNKTDTSADTSALKELSKKADELYKKATSVENTLAAKFAKAAKDKADTTIKSLQNGDKVDIAKAKGYIEKFIAGAQRKISAQ